MNSKIKYKVTAIVACDPNGGIGINNELPWYIPADLQWFKEKTVGKTCIASKSLYLRDLKDLKGRDWIAMSSEPGELSIPEYNYNHWTPKQIADAESRDVMIVGGPKVYEWAYDDLDEVILTGIKEVHKKCDAFVDVDKLIEGKQCYEVIDTNPYYKFTTWRKNG